MIRFRKYAELETDSPLLMEPGGSLPCSQEPAIVSILSQMNSVHIVTTYFFKIHVYINPSSVLFHSDFFPDQGLHAFLTSPERASCLAHFILDSITF
jgi:hypothetical protein